MRLFEIFGQITVDNNRANNALDDTDRRASNTGNAFSKMGGMVVAAAAVAGTAIVAMGGKMIDLASDAQEVQNKFDVVFAGMTEDVEQWNKDYAKAVGRSHNDTKKFLSDQQDILTGLGLSTSEASDLSKEIVSLGIDLGSFQNMTDEQALNALGSALRGSSEAASGFGADISVATIKQSKYYKQLGKTYEELSQVEKMQLRLNVITSQSGNAIGDAERSSGSYANQLKRLQGNIKDVATDLGKQLIPIATNVVKFFNDNMPTIEKVATKVFDVLKAGFAKAGEVIDTVFMPVIDAITPILEYLWKTIERMMPAIKKSGESNLGFLQQAFQGVADVIESLAPFIKALIYAFELIFPIIQWLAEKVLENLIKQFQTVVDVVTFFLDGIIAVGYFIDNTFIFIGEKIKEAFAGVKNFIAGIVDVFTKIGDAIAWVWEGVKNFFGIGDENIDVNITETRRQVNGRRATGGNVTKGGSYIVNEQQQEIFTPNQNGFITPASKINTEDKQATNVTNHNVYNVTIPAEDIEQFKSVTEFFGSVTQLKRAY